MIFVVETKNQTESQFDKQPTHVWGCCKRHQEHACMHQHVRQVQRNIWNR